MDVVSGVLELLVVIAVILVRASAKSGKKEANMQRSARKLNEQKRELTESMSQKQRERMQTLQQSVQQTSGYQSLKQFAERQIQQSRPQQAQRKQAASQQMQQSRPQQAPRKQVASQAYRTAQKQKTYRTAQEQVAGQQKDILARAADNVRENDVDELEQQDLMGAVENLMIMGYQPELSYQRDFLAEGIEMLNTYTVPDMVPEFTMDNSMPTVG